MGTQKLLANRKLVVVSYTEPVKVVPKVVVMSKAVTLPFVESVENVPLAVPPSSKVTPLSVQLMIEAFAGANTANNNITTLVKNNLVFTGTLPSKMLPDLNGPVGQHKP